MGDGKNRRRETGKRRMETGDRGTFLVDIYCLGKLGTEPILSGTIIAILEAIDGREV